ncbi:hypothetical protein B591_00055 [Streptomyces sp. GBA 94-10 4N24]|nr:hypothetical protein B591_00055 [Streptomyces sp. GBA 94-10 4N24]ESQ07660.1 hypothetical protein B590_00055 [Streptomyces sp. PVA_94-07]UZN57053.1 hypothetical protein B591N_00055 [Streptomyces sp. GBA 94-10 4N24]
MNRQIPPRHHTIRRQQNHLKNHDHEPPSQSWGKLTQYGSWSRSRSFAEKPELNDVLRTYSGLRALLGAARRGLLGSITELIDGRQGGRWRGAT